LGESPFYKGRRDPQLAASLEGLVAGAPWGVCADLSNGKPDFAFSILDPAHSYR